MDQSVKDVLKMQAELKLLESQLLKLSESSDTGELLHLNHFCGYRWSFGRSLQFHADT